MVVYTRKKQLILLELGYEKKWGKDLSDLLRLIRLLYLPMERMLRKRKDNSDYEIDRELTGMFAIEKNAEYQNRIAELEEENKKLREELSVYDREYFDEEEKAKYPFMEEDTLQELRDLGVLKDDELIYEEGLYD